MRRPSRFEVRGALLRPPVAERGESSAIAPTPGDPIRELLLSLRGQQVVLQVGPLRQEGRLLSVDPLILVGPQGRAIMIRLESVAAVEF